jgi:hypothetical protein
LISEVDAEPSRVRVIIALTFLLVVTAFQLFSRNMVFQTERADTRLLLPGNPDYQMVQELVKLLVFLLTV